MVDILSRIIVITTLLLLIAISDTNGSQQQAERNAVCARSQNVCQTQCVFKEMTIPTQTSNSGAPGCNPKNHRISQCKNQCYNQYITCRGGK